LLRSPWVMYVKYISIFYFTLFLFLFFFFTDARSLGSFKGGMTTDSDMYDTGDDEILEACVRTAATPLNKPHRERRRSRNHRKSCKHLIYFLLFFLFLSSPYWCSSLLFLHLQFTVDPFVSWFKMKEAMAQLNKHINWTAPVLED
jgi:hypothetical protein